VALAEHLENGSPLPDPVLALLGPGTRYRPRPVARLELLRTCPALHSASKGEMIERAFGPYLRLATIAETLGTQGVASLTLPISSSTISPVWYHLAWARREERAAARTRWSRA